MRVEDLLVSVWKDLDEESRTFHLNAAGILQVQMRKVIFPRLFGSLQLLGVVKALLPPTSTKATAGQQPEVDWAPWNKAVTMLTNAHSKKSLRLDDLQVDLVHAWFAGGGAELYGRLVAWQSLLLTTYRRLVKQGGYASVKDVRLVLAGKALRLAEQSAQRPAPDDAVAEAEAIRIVTGLLEGRDTKLSEPQLTRALGAGRAGYQELLDAVWRTQTVQVAAMHDADIEAWLGVLHHPGDEGRHQAWATLMAGEAGVARYRTPSQLMLSRRLKVAKPALDGPVGPGLRALDLPILRRTTRVLQGQDDVIRPAGEVLEQVIRASALPLGLQQQSSRVTVLLAHSLVDALEVFADTFGDHPPAYRELYRRVRRSGVISAIERGNHDLRIASVESSVLAGEHLYAFVGRVWGSMLRNELNDLSIEGPDEALQFIYRVAYSVGKDLTRQIAKQADVDEVIEHEKRRQLEAPATDELLFGGVRAVLYPPHHDEQHLARLGALLTRGTEYAPAHLRQNGAFEEKEFAADRQDWDWFCKRYASVTGADPSLLPSFTEFAHYMVYDRPGAGGTEDSLIGGEFDTAVKGDKDD